MSRALSRGNEGPSRSSSSAWAFPISTPCASADRRVVKSTLVSQFNIRGLAAAGSAPSFAGRRLRRRLCWPPWLRISLLRLGARSFKHEESFRGSASKAPKRNLGSRPTTSRMRRRSGVDAPSCRAKRRRRPAYIVPSLMHPSAHTQQDSSRAVATLATTGLMRRAAKPCLRLTRRAIPSAAWLAMRGGTASS